MFGGSVQFDWLPIGLIVAAWLLLAVCSGYMFGRRIGWLVIVSMVAFGAVYVPFLMWCYG